MTFLNTAYLWGLPLLVLPFLLHLIFKRPPRRMVFSYVNWIKEVHQRSMPRKKLREIFLLILRTLMIGAVVMFFTRPMLKPGEVIPSSSDNSTIIFLVDVSASMGAKWGGQDALTRLGNEIPYILRKIPSETRIGYVTYSDRVEDELAPTLERTRVLSLFQSLKPTSRSTNMAQALGLAYEMMSNQARGRKTMVIISDHARHGYSYQLSGQMIGAHYDPDVQVVLWEIIPEVPNVGIRSFSIALSGEGLLKGQWTRSSVNSLASETPWKLNLNDRVVAQGVLTRQDRSEDPVPFQAQLPAGGYYSGQLELNSDAFHLDDIFYFAGRVPKGFRLLMVDGESGLAPSDSELYYLQLALDSARDPRLQVMTIIRPEMLDQQKLDGFDAIVMANVGLMSEESQSRLMEWVQSGGGLFLSAGSKWPKDAHEVFPTIRVQPVDSERAHLKKPLTHHPFLSAIAGSDEFQWDQVEIHTSFPLDENSSLTKLVELDNGRPILVKKEFGKGIVLIWLSSLDRDWTNFPAKPLYPPFIRESVATLADPLRDQTFLSGWLGEPIRLNLSSDIRSITIVNPHGASAGARVSEGVVEWANTDVAGLYQVRTNSEKEHFYFAINIPNREQEGNLQRVKLGELKIIFPQTALDWIAPGKGCSDRLLALLQGRDLTGALLIILLILFGIETWMTQFVYWGRRKKTIAVVLSMMLICLPISMAGEGNKFVFCQLKHEGVWDPYPTIAEPILSMVQSMTNIAFSPHRKVVTLMDSALFESPFLVVKGNSAFQPTPPEKLRLKQFIDGGGFVFFDDTLANPRSAFAKSIRTLFFELYPDRSFQRLPNHHSVYRSFFLLRGVGGRRIAEKYFEGLDVGGNLGGEGRTAVIYSANDLLGTWLRDPLGRYAFSCEPGGEPQRWESFKLTLNIIYFSLTGTYKRDAIHQPFIERKLGS